METFKLQLMAGIVAITGILYLIPYLIGILNIKKTWRHAARAKLYMNYFVHGLMIALIFCGLLPESQRSFDEVTEKGQCLESMEKFNIVPLIFLGVMMGAILFNEVIKQIICSKCTNRVHTTHAITGCEMTCEDELIKEPKQEPLKELSDFIPFMLALFLHSTLDGLIIGVLDKSSPFLAFFLAIIGHRMCVTLTVAGKAYNVKNMPKSLHVLFFVLFVGGPALGIFAGSQITSSLSFCRTSIATILINSTAAGLLFEVIFFRMLPTSLMITGTLKEKLPAVAFTMLGCIIMLIFAAIEDTA